MARGIVGREWRCGRQAGGEDKGIGGISREQYGVGNVQVGVGMVVMSGELGV